MVKGHMGFPRIREHRIPTPGSKPYILTLGPDGNLWFCQSGASKIGRLSPKDGTFTEFAVPTPDSQPIGIITGADGNLWFTEYSAHKIGRITLDGKITEFPLPTHRMPVPTGSSWDLTEISGFQKPTSDESRGSRREVS